MITPDLIKIDINRIFLTYGLNIEGPLASRVIDSLTDSMNELVIREHESFKYSLILIAQYQEHFFTLQKIINEFQKTQNLQNADNNK
jgi:hypothetical protein